MAGQTMGQAATLGVEQVDWNKVIVQQDDNVEQVVVMRKSVDSTFFEHDGVQFDDVVCQDIDPQVPEDGTECLIINTILYT